jgi:hypothetical protein
MVSIMPRTKSPYRLLSALVSPDPLAKISKNRERCNGNQRMPSTAGPLNFQASGFSQVRFHE